MQGLAGEKSPMGLFRRTFQLRARFAGCAVNPYTCWNRSVFYPGRAGVKKYFKGTSKNRFEKGKWVECTE